MNDGVGAENQVGDLVSGGAVLLDDTKQPCLRFGVRRGLTCRVADPFDSARRRAGGDAGRGEGSVRREVDGSRVVLAIGYETRYLLGVGRCGGFQSLAEAMDVGAERVEFVETTLGVTECLDERGRSWRESVGVVGHARERNHREVRGDVPEGASATVQSIVLRHGAKGRNTRPDSQMDRAAEALHTELVAKS